MLCSKYKSLYNRYKRGADNRGISFELSEEKFLKLVTSKCSFCGIEPFQKHNGVTYMGIDRTRNDKGYSDVNCSPCCKRCNYAKGSMGFVEFDDWLDQLVDYQIKMRKLYENTNLELLAKERKSGYEKFLEIV